MQQQAEERVSTCRTNTVGYVRCADANADLQQVRTLVSAARERSEAETKSRELQVTKNACDKGEARACLDLHRISDESQDTATSLRYRERAELLLQKGCDADGADDCLTLAALAKPEERSTLLRKACGLQSAAACERVAEMDKEAERARLAAAALAEEVRSGRCEPRKAEALQNVLKSVSDHFEGYRDTLFQVVDHKLVVAVPDGKELQFEPIIGGELRILVFQHFSPIRLEVLDQDGYPVSTRAPESDGVAAWLSQRTLGQLKADNRVVRVGGGQQVDLKVTGKGCALVVIVRRL